MNAITLHRLDSTRNMRRFYRLELQRDLFGLWCFICEWGRIGTDGASKAVPYASADEAQHALDRQRAVKERRGYVAIAKH